MTGVRPRPAEGRRPVAARRPERARVLVLDRADPDEARRGLLRGLLEQPAQIPPKYFYDELGAALYGAITQLPEYYLTRIEAEILRVHRDAICAALPSRGQWIDLGCGDGAKSAAWLQATRACRYVGVDAAEAWLRTTLGQVAHDAAIETVGVVADLSQPWSLRRLIAERPDAPPVFFYPGSSIGNFVVAEAHALLRNVRRHCDDGGCLLIGVDLVKDPARLVAAYDDASGVTAAFNRNVLRVVNRELDADFEPGAFRHVALFNGVDKRIEMHLESRVAQRVRLGLPASATRNFAVGERIITEYSHKYTAQGFSELLTMAGFTRQTLWTDASGDPGAAAYCVFLASA